MAKRIAQIATDGTVLNIIVVPDAFSDPTWDGLDVVDVQTDAEIGGTYDSGTDTFTPPGGPPDMDDISQRYQSERAGGS